MAKNGTTKTQPKEKDFIVKRMPTEVVQRMRACANLDGVSLRQAVVAAFQEYLKAKGV